MTYTALLTNATVKNNFRLRAVVVVSTGVIFICVIGLAVLFGTQFIAPEAAKAAPDRSVLENFLGLILFTTSFITIGIYDSVFAFQSMIREKARGAIHALLATPVKSADIWLGKSLGVFLPGLALGVVMTLAAFLAINYIYLVPDTGFIITLWMIISNFIAVPLVYLALILLVHMIGLTGKAGTGNIIAQIFLPVVVALMINLAVRGLSAGSWLFAVILFAIAFIIGAIVLILRRRLSSEKIVLSSGS